MSIFRKGSLLKGRLDDEGRYYRCPNCGFRIDSWKVVKDDQWHVTVNMSASIATEEGLTILTEEGEEIRSTSSYLEVYSKLLTEDGNYLMTEDGNYLTTEETYIEILTEESVQPVITGGCPFCGLGAW